MKKRAVLSAVVFALCLTVQVFAQAENPIPADRWGAGRTDQVENFNRNLSRSVFGDGGYTFVTGIENSLAKVYRDKYRFKGKLTDKVHISCARNEYGSFQLAVISAAGKSLANVTLRFSDLINKKSGARIEKSAMRHWIVGYVETEETILPAFTGEWPDPLIETASFNVARDELQPVWVEINVPASAEPGDYTGRISIAADGAPSMDVAVNLRVRNFTLPEEQVFRTCTWVFPEPLKARYGEEAEKEMFRKYCAYFLEHKINPINIGSSYYETGDFSVVDDNIVFGLKNGLSVFQIPRLEGDELAEFCGRLKEKGWFDKAMIYGYRDEPSEEDYPAFKKDSERIRNTVPGLKIFMAESPHPGLYGAVDVWWASMADDNRRYNNERLRAGDEVWWYRCGIPVRCEFKRPYSEYPSDALIDRPGIDMRILYWMTWKFKMTPATFFFCGNLWGENIPEEWPGGKESLELSAQGTETYSGTRNGDGWVVYPGPDGPLPSIRLKCMRDGIEDYEYLWALKNEYEKLTAEGGEKHLIKETEEILSVSHELIVDTDYYAKDPKRLFKYREKIAAQIEKLRARE